MAHPELDPARKALALRQHLLEFQAAVSSLSACRQPIIVALHGISLGLAIDLASACDIRLAASNAVFGIQEVNVGLAADIGTLQRFPKIVGNDSMARELAMTGRKFDAAEAKEIGFISKVVSGGRGEVVGGSLLIVTHSPLTNSCRLEVGRRVGWKEPCCSDQHEAPDESSASRSVVSFHSRVRCPRPYNPRWPRVHSCVECCNAAIASQCRS